MDLDRNEVRKVVGKQRRFVSPFFEPYGYYIWEEEGEHIDEKTVELYWEKLNYALKNAEYLVKQAFQISYYEDTCINRFAVESPEDMCQRLIFESFVLVPDRKEIGCCLSNPDFMAGHYIECYWDYDWNFIYSSIC